MARQADCETASASAYRSPTARLRPTRPQGLSSDVSTAQSSLSWDRPRPTGHPIPGQSTAMSTPPSCLRQTARPSPPTARQTACIPVPGPSSQPTVINHCGIGKQPGMEYVHKVVEHGVGVHHAALPVVVATAGVARSDEFHTLPFLNGGVSVRFGTAERSPSSVS